METKPVTLTFQLLPEQRRALKILAAQLGQPLRMLLSTQVEKLLHRPSELHPPHDPDDRIQH